MHRHLLWLYRTGNDGKAPIILYDYKTSRGGKNAADYLKGFKGYIHTDGYAGYEYIWSFNTLLANVRITDGAIRRLVKH